MYKLEFFFGAFALHIPPLLRSTRPATSFLELCLRFGDEVGFLYYTALFPRLASHLQEYLGSMLETSSSISMTRHRHWTGTVLYHFFGLVCSFVLVCALLYCRFLAVVFSSLVTYCSACYLSFASDCHLMSECAI